MVTKETKNLSNQQRSCFLEFPPNVVEQNFDFDGVKVRVKKNSDDSYQIWIEDSQDRFIQSKLLGGYNFYTPNNLISLDDKHDLKWWCNGYFKIHNKIGYFCNGDLMNLEQIQSCVEAVDNGVNKLKELQKPEIIKIGNVTIEKKRIDSKTCAITIDGLPKAKDYPISIMNGGVAWHVCNSLCSIRDDCVYDLPMVQLKDFKCTNSDADKIIEIITKSEEKLARYRWEQNNKDIKEHVFEIKDKDICVKIVPEYDIPFSINRQLPKFLGYKIYINAPKPFIDTLIRYEPLNCDVEYLNKFKRNMEIMLRKATLDCGKDWVLIIPGDCDRLSKAFNNGDMFYKELAERMFCYISAYLQAWCRKEDVIIKIGEKVYVKGNLWWPYEIIGIHENMAWLISTDSQYSSVEVKQLAKKEE